MREDTPGTVEILLLDFPAVTAITGTYSSGSDFQVQQSSPPQSIPEFPPSPDGTQYHVTGATNPASGSTEVYIQASYPGLDDWAPDDQAGGIFGSISAWFDDSRHDALKEMFPSLWLTTRRLTGDRAGFWEPPVLLDHGSRFISFAPTDVQTFATFARGYRPGHLGKHRGRDVRAGTGAPGGRRSPDGHSDLPAGRGTRAVTPTR